MESEDTVEPVGKLVIVDRMLTNLEGIATRAGDMGALRWALRLRTALPEASPELVSRLRAITAKLN